MGETEILKEQAFSGQSGTSELTRSRATRSKLGETVNPKEWATSCTADTSSNDITLKELLRLGCRKTWHTGQNVQHTGVVGAREFFEAG